ncbi:MAG: TetR/AcrR family transcriptional regulator [Clostridiales bacterium]|nr:TetR/AcrR family transcriptional regulator [Clostridiales bacterium]
MPSATFLRLPDTKSARIFEAAVEEFAAYRFREASINRVIKAAGISRGSFYQYFKDKEDLYTYVLQEISKEKLGVISGGGHPQDMSFYELIRAAMPQIFTWVEQNDRYSRIGLLMLEDDPAFLRRVMLNMTDSLFSLREMFRRDQGMGILRPGVQVKTVIQLLVSAASSMIRAYYESGSKEESLQQLMCIIDIICHGISAKPDGGVKDGGKCVEKREPESPLRRRRPGRAGLMRRYLYGKAWRVYSGAGAFRLR